MLVSLALIDPSFSGEPEMEERGAEAENLWTSLLFDILPSVQLLLTKQHDQRKKKDSATSERLIGFWLALSSENLR